MVLKLNSGLESKAFPLSVRDLCDGIMCPGFGDFRNTIVNQLKTNYMFFAYRFLDLYQTSPAERGKEVLKQYYIRISVDIGPAGEPLTEADEEGLEEEQFEADVQVTVDTPNLYEDAPNEPLKSQIGSIHEWRKELESSGWGSGNFGIAVAIDFTVKYPGRQVYFGVQLGIPVPEGLLQSWVPLDLHLSWISHIRNALGDQKQDKLADFHPMAIILFMARLDPVSLDSLDLVLHDKNILTDMAGLLLMLKEKLPDLVERLDRELTVRAKSTRTVHFVKPRRDN